MNEIELKFVVEDHETRALRTKLKAMEGLQDAPTTKLLRSVYYDTPDQALRRDGIALRLRKDGRRWIQTVKAKPKYHGGLQTVREAECVAPAGRLQLELIPDQELRDRITTLVNGAGLDPVCETAIRRSAAVLEITSGTIELAVDSGDIKAGDQAEPFHEVELELKAGSVASLFDLTGTLFPEGGLRFSRMSKSARGYLLASDGKIDHDLAPRNAKTIPLVKEQSAETAARDVLRECFDQIVHNIEVVRFLDVPEGPHQLRIGLRRLRSAFGVFKPTIGTPEMDRLNAEARWLGAEVGIQRDLDVAIVDLLEPEAKAFPNEPGFAVMAEILAERGNEHREVLRNVLTSARTQTFLLDLARFIETRGWLMPHDYGQTQRLAMPVEELAGYAVEKRWKKCCARARGIDTLEIEARHELRKELKKLRYSIEFFAPLMPAKRVTAFVKQLKKLQNVFGDLNDVAMAEELFLAPGAPGLDNPLAQRAVGRLLGSRMMRAEHGWHEAKTLWHNLRATKPCW